MRGFQTAVDAVLEGAEAGLSNAALTSAWKPHTGEWLAFNSELISAGFSVDPLGSGAQEAAGEGWVWLIGQIPAKDTHSFPVERFDTEAILPRS